MLADLESSSDLQSPITNKSMKAWTSSKAEVDQSIFFLTFN